MSCIHSGHMPNNRVVVLVVVVILALVLAGAAAIYNILYQWIPAAEVMS
jgi:hypothetical protein